MFSRRGPDRLGTVGMVDQKPVVIVGLAYQGPYKCPIACVKVIHHATDPLEYPA